MQPTLFDPPPPPPSPPGERDPPTSRPSRLVLGMVRRHPGATTSVLWQEANEYERWRLCDVRGLAEALGVLVAAGWVRLAEGCWTVVE